MIENTMENHDVQLISCVFIHVHSWTLFLHLRNGHLAPSIPQKSTSDVLRIRKNEGSLKKNADSTTLLLQTLLLVRKNGVSFLKMMLSFEAVPQSWPSKWPPGSSWVSWVPPVWSSGPPGRPLPSFWPQNEDLIKGTTSN